MRDDGKSQEQIPKEVNNSREGSDIFSYQILPAIFNETNYTENSEEDA